MQKSRILTFDSSARFQLFLVHYHTNDWCMVLILSNQKTRGPIQRYPGVVFTSFFLNKKRDRFEPFVLLTSKTDMKRFSTEYSIRVVPAWYDDLYLVFTKEKRQRSKPTGPKNCQKRGTVHDTTVVFSVNFSQNELVECMWYMYVIGTQHALVTL